ncbi:MAG TPA: PIN domain-containing protein [Hyphomicrobiales bacterium]|nr:PIN domain-containing protein [Hyphomicrobiales bacterium]
MARRRRRHRPSVSAVTIGELQAGIELTRGRDSARASEIEAWLEQVAAAYDILSMDTFRQRARLMHHRSDELIEDAMIAAAAIVHDLTVVTRNVRDFAAPGRWTRSPPPGRNRAAGLAGIQPHLHRRTIS